MTTLSDLIESAWEAGPDPDDIAAKVEPKIPESEVRTVLRFLLARYIAVSKPRLAQVIAADHAERATQQGSRPQRSAKAAAIREHGRFLRLMVKVGHGESKWLEQCTYEDLQHAATVRRDKAAQTLLAAEQYEALAELLQLHDAETVGDLPRSVLTAYLADWRAAA